MSNLQKFFLGLGLMLFLFVAWKVAANQEVREGFSQRFVLQDLRVNSESPDVEARVREGLKKKIGYGLFDLNLKEIKAELVKIPRVESVEVYRRWPDTLIVNAIERAPVAMAFRGTTLMLVDRDGNWIEELRSPKGLPLLVGADDREFPIKKICNWIFSIQSAGEPSYLSFSKIDEISWSRGYGLVIRSASLDLRVTMGFTDFDAKWDRAQKAYFYSYQRGRTANWVDANNLRRVILSADNSLTATSNPNSNAISNSSLNSANQSSHTVF